VQNKVLLEVDRIGLKPVATIAGLAEKSQGAGHPATNLHTFSRPPGPVVKVILLGALPFLW
jgi:hypothetical protein